jgi:hypothetical protein
MLSVDTICMEKHILLTNQNPNRPVVDPKHMTADTLCGREAQADSVEFAVAARAISHGVVCGDCAGIYQRPEYARMRGRS